jgi:hypothetical protein
VKGSLFFKRLYIRFATGTGRITSFACAIIGTPTLGVSGLYLIFLCLNILFMISKIIYNVLHSNISILTTSDAFEPVFAPVRTKTSKKPALQLM